MAKKLKRPNLPVKPIKPIRLMLHRSVTIYVYNTTVESLIDQLQKSIPSGRTIADVTVSINHDASYDRYDDYARCDEQSLSLNWQEPEPDKQFERKLKNYEKELAKYKKLKAAYDKWEEDNKEALDAEAKAIKQNQIKQLESTLKAGLKLIEEQRDKLEKLRKDADESSQSRME